MKKIYTTWDGKIVNGRRGDKFIATSDEAWTIRYKLWVECQWNNDNECPCPMPERHIMFD